MFFSQDILQKRGGKFGIIWLAATRYDQLTRRDYSNVNVSKSCDDIIDHILLRAKPTRPGMSRPRFSLYLSSQLMFGIVRVYVKQSDYLLGDATALTNKLRLSTVHTAGIDLKPGSRANLVTMTDPVPLGDLSRPDYNPEFGRLVPLDESITIPSMADNIAVEEISVVIDHGSPAITAGDGHYSKNALLGFWGSSPEAEELSPSMRRDITLPSTPTGPQSPYQPEFRSPHTVPNKEITMQEIVNISLDQQFPLPGEELPALDGAELDIMLDEVVPDINLLELHDGEKDKHFATSPLRDVHREQIHDITEVLSWDQVLRNAQEAEEQLQEIEEQHTARVVPGNAESTTMVTADISKDVLPDGHKRPLEVTPSRPSAKEALPARRDLIPSPGLTPIFGGPTIKRKRISMHLEDLSPITPSPARRRKRQLLFADADTQISKAQLKKQLKLGHTTCQVNVLPSKEDKKLSDIFNLPGSKVLLNPRLLPLWKRNAVRGVYKESDSDLERVAWTVPQLREGSSSDEIASAPESSVVQQTVPSPDIHQSNLQVQREDTIEASVELARAQSLTDLVDLPDRTDVSLEQSTSLISEPHERTRDSLHEISERRLSSRRAGISSDEDDLLLQDETMLSFTNQKLPALHEEPEEGDTLLHGHHDLAEIVRHHTTVDTWTTFKTICPITESRITAAKKFSALLDLKMQEIVRLRQTKAYGDIYIGRGSLC